MIEKQRLYFGCWIAITVGDGIRGGDREDDIEKQRGDIGGQRQ